MNDELIRRMQLWHLCAESNMLSKKTSVRHLRTRSEYSCPSQVIRYSDTCTGYIKKEKHAGIQGPHSLQLWKYVTQIRDLAKIQIRGLFNKYRTLIFPA